MILKAAKRLFIAWVINQMSNRIFALELAYFSFLYNLYIIYNFEPVKIILSYEWTRPKPELRTRP